MLNKVIHLTNKNKLRLVEFEKTLRMNEPDIWFNDFDETKYRRQVESADFDKEHSHVFCIEVDGIIIGRCDLILQENLYDFSTTGYIDWIYIDIRYRCRGFGRALLDAVFDYSKQIGLESCYLFTAKNEHAKRFYKGINDLILEDKEVASKVF